MFVDYIEKSPTSRAKCRSCGNVINSGEWRGVEFYDNNYYTNKRYYCRKCTEIILRRRVKDVSQMLSQITNRTKKLYLVKVNIHDEYPAYTFLVEAKDEIEANEKAQKIAKDDYGENYFSKGYDMAVYEIKTLGDVKTHLLLD